MEHSEDSHHQVEKIWHNSDITKNWTSLQNWWKDEKKTGQGGCQDAYSNINCSGITNMERHTYQIAHPLWWNIDYILGGCEIPKKDYF